MRASGLRGRGRVEVRFCKDAAVPGIDGRAGLGDPNEAGPAFAATNYFDMSEEISSAARETAES